MESCRGVAQGKLLAGVNSRVHIFKWVRREDATFELANECTYTGHILALYMQCRGDFIIVGARPLGLPLNQRAVVRASWAHLISSRHGGLRACRTTHRLPNSDCGRPRHVSVHVSVDACSSLRCTMY